jgi:DnaK suppressor protein
VNPAAFRTVGEPGFACLQRGVMTGDTPERLPPGAAAAIRDALAAERQQTLDRITAVSREFDGIVESSAGVATDDEHDPEGATIAFERAQLAALLDQARSHLTELDDALDRLRQGRYGRCERCGGPIAAGRLAARPAARTCITCAAAR